MSEESGRDVLIFTEALRLPVEERAAFLDQACAGDEKLRREVEALLNAHGRVGNFLEKPLLDNPPQVQPEEEFEGEQSDPRGNNGETNAG
jgi:serine/threonine-protein kinase